MVTESRGDAQALERAEAELAPVLERNARSVEANLLAGRIATMRNQPAIAANYYRAVIAVNPNNAAAYLGLGNALTALQDTRGADAAFARYQELMGLNRP
jgi:predicted Zn-dependent protease